MEKKLLEPPVLEKNWLISPPGSPTEGWVQVEEDPPNSFTLHEDIQAALDRLALELGQTEAGETDNAEKPSGNVILDTTSLGGVQVIVHDWDSMKEMDEFGDKNICEPRTSAAVIGRTPRPPVNFE
jgi:calcipressin-2